jgi:hypothetical protein
MLPFIKLNKRIQHRYLLNGSPRNCAFCAHPLVGDILRSGDRYFCDTLCAEFCLERVSEKKAS